MCQQLSDYVVGSYTKCVNKRRYISWTLGEIPAPIDHIQCSRHSVKMAKTQVYCGMFVHSTKKDYMRILQNHAIGVKEGKVGINSKCSYDLVGLNLYRKFSPNYHKSRVIGNGILKNRPMISRTERWLSTYFLKARVSIRWTLMITKHWYNVALFGSSTEKALLQAVTDLNPECIRT